MDSWQNTSLSCMSDTTPPVVLVKTKPHGAACGHANPPDAVFCGECGASLQTEPPCSTCGRTNPTGLKFCRGCGARLLVPLPSSTLTLPLPATRTTLANGRYQIQRLLGEGAKKRVYLAHDTQLDREVALALFKTESLDEAGRTRIRREAQALSQLGDHQHIVTLYDVNEEDGQPYFISQYLAGGSLQELLQRMEHHCLPLVRAFSLADEICQALEHAHAHGIVHRDLKPSNVWLTQEGVTKLGDFGLATSLDHSRFSLEGVLVGTAAYLPPEHLQGKKLDARSDLYSLGAMLYEMVAGRPPFMGDSLVSLIAQHLNVSPVAPSQYNPEIPAALDALLLQLLAKTPDERPQSASDVRVTLRALATATATGSVQSVAPQRHALDRLVSDVFVGRERESDTLRDDLEEALTGRGRVVVIAGEPGIGKTRLATELTVYARLRGARLLVGRCHEDEGAPPYWPWVQMLRAYAAERSSEHLRAEMGAGGADIVQIIPDLQELYPALPAPPPLDPEQARFRFFDSFTTFLKNAAKRHPLVVLLDDLQWADPSSLLLLQFVACEISEARLLMILTCREEETEQRSPLAQTLAAIARTVSSKTLPLRSLTASDVTRFMELTTGQPPSQELVTAMYQETEGHPFFMTEAVRLWATEERHATRCTPHAGFRVPQSVRAVMARRLAQVSAECRQLLTVAAVCGREFNLTVLGNVVEAAQEDCPGQGNSPGLPLLSTLDEALAARLLTAIPDSVGRYGFSHALLRTTLYEALPLAQRLQLHRLVGEALEELAGAHPEPLLAELAHHFFQATADGNVDKAIAYAKLAAEHTTAALAYEEAAAHYERTLQLLDARTPDDELRCSVLLTLGEVRQSAGNPTAARTTFRQAAELARRLLQQSGASLAAPLLARAALGAGGMLLMTSVGDPEVISLLEEALRALNAEDSLLRARVLARLAMEIRFSGSQARCINLSEQAVAVARRAGDLATVAAMLGVKRYVIWAPENLTEQLTVATTMVQAAEEAGNKEAKLDGLLWQVVDQLEAGDLAAAQTASALHASLAQDLRHGFHLWRQAILQAARALCLGQLEKGEQLVQDALTLGQRTQPQPARQAFGVQLYRLRKDQGRLPELESLVKALVERNPTFPVWRCGLAAVYCAADRKDEAAREFAALATCDFADFPRDMNWLIGMALLSEVCVYLQDTRAAAALYALLLPYAERNVLVGLAYAYFGSAAYYLGLLATTLQRWDAATAHFTAALQRHTRTGARPFVAYTQYEYARMLLARNQPGDHEKAVELLEQALATAQELGMAGLEDKVSSLKSQVSSQKAEGTKTATERNSELGPLNSNSRTLDVGLRTSDLHASRLTPHASSAQHSALSTQEASTFRRDGDYWIIVHQDVTSHLQDLRGLHYLAHLLRYPHTEFHATELVALVSGAEVPSPDQTVAEAFQSTLSITHLGDAGEMLDPQAKAEYKQRLIDLRDELQEAETFNDVGRVERLRAEIDFLTQELTNAVGLGGRHRKAASQAERARVNVTRTLRAALGKIAESHPALGRYLSNTIRTGLYCSYVPDSNSSLIWEF